MAIKVGCATWLFTEPAHNPPYEDAVKTIGDLGFDGVEFILRDYEDINGYWNKKRMKDLKVMIDHYGMEACAVAMFQNITEGLADLDPVKKQHAIDAFEFGCEITNELESPVMDFVSPWPWEITCPNSYIPEYYYINVPGVDPRIRTLQTFQTKLKFNFPHPFDWNRYWENHVDAIHKCAVIAKQHGLKLAIENHANTMTPHTDSILMLAEDVGMDNVGVNLDSVWAFLQREYVPWSIHKYDDKLFHVHVRDGDGLAAYNVPVGYGVMDWKWIIHALKEVNYDGYLSMEWSHDRYKRDNSAFSLKYLRDLLAKVD